jgi:hypothetical protein
MSTDVIAATAVFQVKALKFRARAERESQDRQRKYSHQGNTRFHGSNNHFGFRSAMALSCGGSCSNALDNALYREYADVDREQREIEGNYIAHNSLSNRCSLRLSAIMPRRSWNSPRPTSASQPTTSTMKANGIAVAMKMDSIIRYPLFRPTRPEVERVSRWIACLVGDRWHCRVFKGTGGAASSPGQGSQRVGVCRLVDRITKPVDK